MGRKSLHPESTFLNSLTILFICLVSSVLVYAFVSIVITNTKTSSVVEDDGLKMENSVGGCCRGIENLELWGAAVKWGSEFKFNSSVDCCNACKSMCTGNDGPCLCDSWVFCGNRENCGSKFGECWLKKQRDSLAPERQDAGVEVRWTSGLIFGKGEGIIELATEHGALRIKLFPDCAPHSVAYILELLALRHCAGCQFFRAEGLSQSWDSEGNHFNNSPFGPPSALLQGSLEAQGNPFNEISLEDCPTIRRGSVAWVNSGPEFFISLANHGEWKKSYTVFGYVLPEDMSIAEKIAALPTVSDVWNNINVSILEKPVPLFLRRIQTTLADININANSD